MNDIQKVIYLVSLILFLMLCGGNLNAKVSMTLPSIEFNSEFKPIDPVSGEPAKETDKELIIPFGKTVLLSGTLKAGAIELWISWAVNSKVKKIKAEVQNSHWEAQVGPFPPGESVAFHFYLNYPIPEESKDQFAKELKNSIAQMADQVFQNFDKLSAEALKKLIEKTLKELIPTTYNEYRNVDNKTLKEIVITRIISLDTEKLLKVLNLKGGIEVKNNNKEGYINYLKDTLLADKIVESLQSKKDDLAKIKNFIDDPENFVKVLGTTDIEAAKNALIGIVNNINDNVLKEIKFEENNVTKKNINDHINLVMDKIKEIKESRTEYDKQIEEITNTATKDVLKGESITYAQQFMTSAETSDLERYAGFDVAALYVARKEKGMIGTFFLINPYLKAVDLNRDPRGFLECFSLTLGISLKKLNDEQQGSAYFIGFSYRINKLFRGTAGQTLIKEAGEYKSDWTFGISLNFRDFGDLLKIFKGSGAYFEE